MDALDELINGFGKISKTVTKVKHKLGIEMSIDESKRLLITGYTTINMQESERHKRENPVDAYNLVSLNDILGGLKNKYMQAREKYLNHVAYIYEMRGLTEHMEEILPPYIVFPEQSMKVTHGRFSEAFELFLSKLNENELITYFQKYPLPISYKIHLINNELENRVTNILAQNV